METGSRAPSLWVILDEGVLTRPVGGPAVMRDQIDRLIEAARQPRIINNALAGQVVERAGDVARVALLYDILKAEALPPRASVDLARKAIEQWT